MPKKPYTIKEWEHVDVDKNGIVKAGGAVTVHGCVREGIENGKPFVCVGFPRTSDGVVKGVTIFFNSTKN